MLGSYHILNAPHTFQTLTTSVKIKFEFDLAVTAKALRHLRSRLEVAKFDIGAKLVVTTY